MAVNWPSLKQILILEIVQYFTQIKWRVGSLKQKLCTMISAQFHLSVIQTSATFTWVLISSKNICLQSHSAKQKHCPYRTQGISMESNVSVYFLLVLSTKLSSGDPLETCLKTQACSNLRARVSHSWGGATELKVRQAIP